LSRKRSSQILRTRSMLGPSQRIRRQLVHNIFYVSSDRISDHLLFFRRHVPGDKMLRAT
jgi:hypothetical protein